MRYFFDTEFLEDGKTIDLISIGIVAEDGREFYAVNEEFGFWKLHGNDWMMANVVPSLPVDAVYAGKGKLVRFDKRVDSAWNTREGIASDILAFVGDSPEFWAYYADYDWVVLCQLYGRMIDLPTGWPMYCRDVKQLADMAKVQLPKQDESEAHNALADARWVKHSYELLCG